MPEQQDTEQTRCKICGTIIEPDPGYGQMSSGVLKSWTPNMSLAFHHEFEAVGPQITEHAKWLEQEARGLASTLQMFLENPHIQDFFGDRLCNTQYGTDYLIGRLQSIAALLARLDVEHGYQPETPPPAPLAPPGWQLWSSRCHLPL